MLFFFKLFFWLFICHVRKMTSSWPCFITKNTRLPSNSRRLACETTFWRSRCFCHYHRTLTTAFGYMKPSTHEFIVQSLNDHDTPRKHLCNYRPVSSVKARWTWVMRDGGNLWAPAAVVSFNFPYHESSFSQKHFWRIRVRSCLLIQIQSDRLYESCLVCKPDEKNGTER